MVKSAPRALRYLCGGERRAARNSPLRGGRLGIDLFLVAALTLAACESAAPPGGPQEDGGSLARKDVLTAAQRRTVEIYAAVIDRLVTKDHTFGRGPSPFDHVYILDRPRQGAGHAPEGPPNERFSHEFKKALAARLVDLPPIDFVARSQAARRGSGIDDGVKHDGVIISLGPVIGDASRVKVSNSLWCGGLCGQWQTYRVELAGGSWHVKGTVGPVAIS